MASQRNSNSSDSNPKKAHVPKDICFVIMPFGEYFDIYYQEIYKLAIEEADLIPIRATGTCT